MAAAKTVRRLAVAACLVFAATTAGWARRVSGRMPSHRPPSMPYYRGRRLRVPHLGPGVGLPRRQRPAQPVTAPQRFAPAARPAPGEPKTDFQGRPLRAKPVRDLTRTAPMVHETIGAAPFAKSVAVISRDAGERDGRFHWHNVNGVWASHWYDRAHGQDWIGVYRGDRHFWSIYWHDHFWWQEPGQRRWLSFWRDHWWWHSPTGAYFVFIDGQYYAWNPGVNGVTLVAAPPSPPAPPATAAAPTVSDSETLVVSSQPEFTYSADGTRMVQIEGEELSAYLWDLTRQDAQGGDVMLKFLGQGVTSASFSDAAKGPLRITLSIQDASGAVHEQVLDAQGNPVTSSAPARTPAAPTPPSFGAPGASGFDAPGGDLPPIDAPQPDGD